MKKYFSIFLLILASFSLFIACSKLNSNSTFCITFIDVGQGDAALVECDGHYMLIDGGGEFKENRVYNLLTEKRIQHLDILAISHLHQDHIGGLPKALTYASKIDLTISNSSYNDTDVFKKLERELLTNGSKITVPRVGAHYNLGSARVEVIDVSAQDQNDSLVLLITYGKTRFLFTGDIEEEAQRRIQSKYSYEDYENQKVDLMKMPHHGGETLIQFINIFMPEIAIISVGKNNGYNQPKDETLNRLKQANAKIYRTDEDGDIIVKSNGKDLSIKSSK